MSLNKKVLEKEYMDRCDVKDMILSSPKREIIELKNGTTFIYDKGTGKGFITDRKGEIREWKILVSLGDVKME